MRKPFEVWELEVHKSLLSEDAIALTVGEPTKVLRAWHGFGASPQRVALKLNGRYIATLRAQLAKRQREYDALLSEWIEAHALVRTLVRTANPDGKFDKEQLAAARKYLEENP